MFVKGQTSGRLAAICSWFSLSQKRLFPLRTWRLELTSINESNLTLQSKFEISKSPQTLNIKVYVCLVRYFLKLTMVFFVFHRNFLSTLWQNSSNCCMFRLKLLLLTFTSLNCVVSFTFLYVCCYFLSSNLHYFWGFI